MRIADMMQPTGRVFMKSEFGPIGDQWPCFSFTKKNVGTRLQADYRPGRDIIIYVGTTNPETTEDPDHRSRLISAVSIEPNHILETRKIVPEDRWARTIAKYGENPAYDNSNTQITHLACNWAKNRYGAEPFADWLAIVRDVRPVGDDAVAGS